MAAEEALSSPRGQMLVKQALTKPELLAKMAGIDATVEVLPFKDEGQKRNHAGIMLSW